MTWLVAQWWRLVLFWKRRTGFVDMHESVTITGTVINVEEPDGDGDRNFDVELDAGLERYITGFGGRLTYQRSAGRPSMHCEIPPWMPAALRDVGASLVVGDRVRVTGAWGFDGVHLGVSMPLEILAALVRHGPNVREGWWELHPVTAVDRL